MAIVEGLGNCPLCGQKIEVGSPAKYYQSTGHSAMAHTACITKHEELVNTPEYKRTQAQAHVDQATAALQAAKTRLKRAQDELKALDNV